MTGIFSLTNMSTATGITGGSYQITQSTLRNLGDQGFDRKILKRIGSESYQVTKSALLAAKEAEVNVELITELHEIHLGKSFKNRRLFERFIKTLDNRPRSTRALKAISPHFSKSLIKERFENKETFNNALNGLDLDLTPEQIIQLNEMSYTGWIWTLENFRKMVALPETKTNLINTIL